MMKTHRPLVAILRGVKSVEIADVVETIVEAGITILEVTMNSPDPLKSIEIMVKSVGDRALIGAGTVTESEDVDAIHAAGGQLIISPNMDTDVIKRTKQLGLRSYPGCQTPTECFAALKAGADTLKIFPSSTIGSAGIKALRATLPRQTEIFAVGGVNAGNMSEFVNVGVNGFGIGSALYAPGKSTKDIRQSAQSFVAAWDQTLSNGLNA